jgi:hypothetical protein
MNLLLINIYVMENINEFNNNDDKKISFEEKIRLIKLNNPGKFDHLPDPISRGQNWSDEDVQDLLKIIREKKNIDNNEIN